MIFPTRQQTLLETSQDRWFDLSGTIWLLVRAISCRRSFPLVTAWAVMRQNAQAVLEHVPRGPSSLPIRVGRVMQSDDLASFLLFGIRPSPYHATRVVIGTAAATWSDRWPERVYSRSLIVITIQRVDAIGRISPPCGNNIWGRWQSFLCAPGVHACPLGCLRDGCWITNASAASLPSPDISFGICNWRPVPFVKLQTSSLDGLINKQLNVILNLIVSPIYIVYGAAGFYRLGAHVPSFFTNTASNHAMAQALATEYDSTVNIIGYTQYWNWISSLRNTSVCVQIYDRLCMCASCICVPSMQYVKSQSGRFWLCNVTWPTLQSRVLVVSRPLCNATR